MTCYVSGRHASVSRMQYQLLLFCLAYVEIHTKEKFFKKNTYIKNAFCIKKGFWKSPAGTICFEVKVKSLSRVRLFATPWNVAYQAPPSMGFSRQEYWSGVPFPSPVDLPNPGIEPGSPDVLPSEPSGKP